MRTLNRMAVVGVVLAFLVPLGTSALLFSAAPAGSSTRSALDQIIQQAREKAQQRDGLGFQKVRYQRVITDGEKELVSLGKEKRQLRLRIASLLASLKSVHGKSDALIQEQVRVAMSTMQEQERLLAFLRIADARAITSTSTGPRLGRLILRRLFVESLGDSVAADLTDEALTRAREQLLSLLAQEQEVAQLSYSRVHAAAGSLTDILLQLMSQLEALRSKYLSQLSTIEKAQRTVILSDEQMAEAQREVNQVKADVLQMQAELARIDARIRRKADRELIEKGLKSAHPGSFSDGRVVGAGQFAWPQRGQISAVFHDPGYYAHFGFPHTGIDIVVPQGSPVYSAADGVVFLARDGGDYGFSYILIGHRSGYATLYGHLSSFAVSTGQDVRQGQLIGYSGATPGTHGAGLMTTGPHLHFEVLVNGENIDPMLVLPK